MFHCCRSMVKLYCMLYGVFRSGFCAGGSRRCSARPSPVAGKTRGKITCGFESGFVNAVPFRMNGMSPKFRA